MLRDPLAVALSVGGTGWRPILIVGRERRAVPRALLHHLRDLGIGDFQSMLDGITTAIQRALQTDAIVGVTGYFFAPAVSFVHD